MEGYPASDKSDCGLLRLVWTLTIATNGCSSILSPLLPISRRWSFLSLRTCIQAIYFISRKPLNLSSVVPAHALDFCIQLGLSLSTLTHHNYSRHQTLFSAISLIETSLVELRQPFTHSESNGFQLRNLREPTLRGGH